MSIMRASPTTHRPKSRHGDHETPLAVAAILLHEELPSWKAELCDEVLSVYRRTEVGEADGGHAMLEAMLAYLTGLGDRHGEAFTASRERIAVLYARAGLDLSTHFEMSARLFALLAERAAFRWHDAPAPLVSALIEIQRGLWDDARLITEAFVHARERHLGQLVKQLSVARSELLKLAHDDPLTGIRNRAHLVAALSVELDRAHRYHEPFSLLFADLDHFKLVNDAHGHDAGDRVLKQIATIISDELRPQDVVGRYGGDEIVIGLVRANGSTAQRVAERLRAAVEAAHLPSPDASPFVTLSVGAVTSQTGHESVVELIRRADTAMYAAKSAGRNQVWVGTPPSLP
jgi:diguanylate cyclase (GGDEF)-like protein